MQDELHALLRQLVAQSQENGRLLERILAELSGISQDVGTIAMNTDDDDDDTDLLP
jgi:hypothetical protein